MLIVGFPVMVRSTISGLNDMTPAEGQGLSHCQVKRQLWPVLLSCSRVSALMCSLLHVMHKCICSKLKPMTGTVLMV